MYSQDIVNQRIVQHNLYAQKVLTFRRANLAFYFPSNQYTISGTVLKNFQQDSARDGVLSGVVPHAAIGPGLNMGMAPQYDGLNDFANIYSASLDAAWNGQLFTVMCWAKVRAASVWTDGTLRRALSISVNSNNRIFINRQNTNNIIRWSYIAGGSSSTRDLNTGADTGWMCLGMTVDRANDRMRAYYNGAQQGADVTGLGTWGGSLDSTLCCIGAVDTTGSQSWDGYDYHAAGWSGVEFTAAEMLELARAI